MRILNDMYRTLTKNMLSFPIALPYTPRHLGRLGITKLSATVQQTKLRMLMTGLAEDGRQKKTSESLLSRVGKVGEDDFSNEYTVPEKEHRS